MSATKTMPKDLQAMSSILQDFGITDYDPIVLNQMLEFTYRYVTTIIEDAVLYSSHAKRESIDIEDVRLAIDLQQDKNFASPPSRELTADLARQRNSLPLPTIRSSAGLRLPPDRHSLTSCNFNLKHPTKKLRTVHPNPRMSVTNMAANPVIPRQTFNMKPAPSPIGKFPEGNRVTTPTSMLSQMATAVSLTSGNPQATQILMPNGIPHAEVKLENPNKRMNEDDDYDNH